MQWIHLVQAKDKCGTFANTVMNERLNSCGMCLFVIGYIGSDVSEESNAFILTPKMEAVR